MSQPKHTPGPWIVNGEWDITTDDGADIVAYSSASVKGLHHNAHLIAAAPDMLAALEEIINDDKLMNALAGPRARMIMDAIAKARGEA